MLKDDDDFELEFDDLALSDDFVTITLKELILVVYDSSGSMNENGSSGRPKYKEAEEAVNGFISRLQRSRAVNSFSIAVSVFSDDVKELLKPTLIGDLPNEEAVSLPRPRGNTNLDSGLKWAEDIAEKFLSETDEVSEEAKKVAIVILSDGKVNRGEDPKVRGQRLANLYTLGAGAFGNEAEAVLIDLVTSPDLFIKDPTPDSLRALLERSSVVAMRQ